MFSFLISNTPVQEPRTPDPEVAFVTSSRDDVQVKLSKNLAFLFPTAERTSFGISILRHFCRRL